MVDAAVESTVVAEADADLRAAAPEMQARTDLGNSSELEVASGDPRGADPGGAEDATDQTADVQADAGAQVEFDLEAGTGVSLDGIGESGSTAGAGVEADVTGGLGLSLE